MPELNRDGNPHDDFRLAGKRVSHLIDDISRRGGLRRACHIRKISSVLLSAGLIAAAMFVTPATDRESFVARRHVSETVDANASLTGRYDHCRVRTLAPPIRAVAVAPCGVGVCHVGDKAMVC
jgi:hypothetical protein